MHRWLFLVFFIIVGSSVCVAQDDIQSSDSSFHPTLKPTLDIKRRLGDILVDGELDDAGWQSVATAQDFCQSFPIFGVKPRVRTFAKITYDDEYLYVAMIAEDSMPDEIRVNHCQRDNISGDDFMGIILDTYGDGSRAFEIYCNPYGIQEDLFWTSNDEDGSYDIIYESEAKITATGWQAEFRIPFRSLRFPNIAVQNFHCTFWRSFPREVVHKYSWAPVNFYIPCSFCQFGTLTGIDHIQSSGTFELLPSLVASQSASAPSIGAPMINDKVTLNPSLGARYALGTATGLELALNPDFSQVESDAAQISANTTFALFYPERRPFFQDGSDLLSTSIDAVYTRSINSPLVAAKAIHRDESTSIAYIGAYDQHSPIIIPLEERSIVQSDVGRSISNIFRITHSFGNSTKIGALFTNRSLNGDGSNTVGGFDGRILLPENIEILAQGLISYSLEPTHFTNGDSGHFDGNSYTVEYNGEHYIGYANFLQIQRHTDGLDVELTYQTFSPTFRADNGFIFTNNSRNLNLWTGYKFPILHSSWFSEFDMSIIGSYKGNFDNQTKILSYRPELDFSFIGQTNLHIAYRNGNERYHGIEFKNLYYINAWGNSNPLSWLGLDASIWYGNSIARFLDVPVVGKELDLYFSASLKAFGSLLIQPEYNFSRLDSINTKGLPYFSGAIYRTKFSYQFNRKFSARVIVQYNEFANDLEIDPLITYQINPFTSLYLGSSHTYNSTDAYSPLQPSQRQFFAKLQYLIQG